MRIQKNMTGQLMAIGRTVWGPKVPTLKGTEASLSYVPCFLYPISSSINVSIFCIPWLDTFWTYLLWSPLNPCPYLRKKTSTIKKIKNFQLTGLKQSKMESLPLWSLVIFFFTMACQNSYDYNLCPPPNYISTLLPTSLYIPNIFTHLCSTFN